MAIDKVGNSPARPGGGRAADAPQRPRVFVLSDVRLFRDGVVLALSQQPSVQVIGSSDLSAPPGRIADLSPDALLLDINALGDLEISRAVREVMPEVKIVALGVAEVEQAVMACAKAGVSGFVTPNGSVKDVVAAVHSAVRGELVCSPRTAAMLLSRVSALAAKPAAEAHSDMLTRREREIGSLMSDGMSNKKIASLLGIQIATVKNHVHTILGKLGVRRRGEAAAQLRGARVNGVDNLIFSKLPPTGRNPARRSDRFEPDRSN